MILSFARRCALVAVVMGVAACTEPSAPTAPSITSFQPILEPFLNPAPSVGGVYQGPMFFQGVTGGTGPIRDAGLEECIHDAFNGARASGNDTNDSTMTIVQDETNISKVTIRLTSAETGLACTFSGAIGSSNGLASDAAPGACTGTSLLLKCADGVKEMVLVGSSLSGAFDGWPNHVTAVTGRTAQTYNILDAPTGAPLAGLVASHTFVFNRQ